MLIHRNDARKHLLNVMYKILLLISALLLSFFSFAGELHTNKFGDVFNGKSPFPVGRVNTSTGGYLWCNTFGDIYVEGSPFAVGHLEGVNSEGILYMDEFGDVYVTGSPFKVDAKDEFNLKE